jgi:hypothetical protein
MFSVIFFENFGFRFIDASFTKTCVMIFFLFDSLHVNVLNKTFGFNLAQRMTEKLSLSFKNCPGTSTILLYIINLLFCR